MQRPLSSPPRLLPHSRLRTRLPNGAAVHHVSRLDLAFIYREIFTERCYAQHGVGLRHGDFVLDVGANCGLFALFAAQEGAARVLCCEPSPLAFAALQRTVVDGENSALVASTAIRVRNVAIAERSGTASFTTYMRLPAWSTLCGGAAYEDEVKANVQAYARVKGEAALAVWGPLRPLLRVLARVARAPFFVDVAVRWLLAAKRTEPVELRTVSDLLVEEGCGEDCIVHLIKVDVEGAELNVLRGITAEDWVRIQQVVVEVHDSGGRLGAVRALLSGVGGFSRIVSVQEVPGSNLHTLYASKR